MSIKKIVFLGSKPIGYECLAYLIVQKDALNIEIAGVLTRARKEFGNEHDLTELATTHSIPVIDNLENLPACDIIYSVQYHEIIKQQHIDKASQIAVNLHMAPLPEYRGANQFSFAILDRKIDFGVTIHKIDTRIDHGDILFQKRFPIPENCWVNDLYELTYKASVDLFKKTLANLVAEDYMLVPQEMLEKKFGTMLHFRKEMGDIKVIDLTWAKEKIERHIRATSMPGFEPPYCLMDGRKVYITRSI
jgi:methionyl-tRNA formyltransferase